MVEAGVIDHVELPGGTGELEHVAKDEAQQGVFLLGAQPGTLQCDRRAIDGRDVETPTGQTHGIGPSAAAELQDGSRAEVPFVEDLQQFGMGLVDVPRRGALAVGVFPVGSVHVRQLGQLIHGVGTLLCKPLVCDSGPRCASGPGGKERADRTRSRDVLVRADVPSAAKRRRLVGERRAVGPRRPAADQSFGAGSRTKRHCGWAPSPSVSRSAFPTSTAGVPCSWGDERCRPFGRSCPTG